MRSTRVEQEQKPRERSFVRELVPDWRPTREQVLWVVRTTIALAVVLGILTLIGLPFGITLWEWLKLLIVPIVIAGGVAWLNWAQRQREREADEVHRERELAVERERAQDAALQAHLDQMSQLLLDKDRPLRGVGTSPEGEEIRTLARARTLAVLTMLNSDRKGTVVQFLYELGLITEHDPVLSLSGANLQGADLRGPNPRWTDLREDMEAYKIERRRRFELNQLPASIWHETFHLHDLRKVNLHETNLQGAVLSAVNLRNANFKGAILANANLALANLQGANLQGADLRGADLMLTDLKKANLQGAVGLTDDELIQQLHEARSKLQGTTLPSGQTFDDWILNREL